MITYLIIFLLFLPVCFLYRRLMILLNRSWFKQGLSGDAAVHLKIIEQLNENFWSKKIDQYVVPNKMWYPLLFHHYSWLFPIEKVRKNPWLPNLVLFTFFIPLYLVYIHYIEHHLLHRSDYLITGVSALIFLFSISNLMFTGPAITYIKLSERLIGRLTSSAFYLCLCVGIFWHDKPSEVLSMVFGALTLCSSVFGRQLIFFSVPVLALLLWSPEPLIILAGSLVISVILYRKYFIDSIIMNFKSWSLYFTHYNKDSKFTESVFNRFVSLKKIIAAAKNRDLDGLIFQFTEREPFRTLSKMPELFFFAGMAIWFHQHVDLKLVISLVPVLLAYLITAQKKFTGFGEAYRYLEYGFYLILPFYTALIISDHNTIHIHFAFIQYLEIVGVMFLFLYYERLRTTSYSTTDDLKDFIDKLNLSAEDVVFPIDMNLGARICVRAKCKSFWWQPGGIATRDLYAEYIEKIPFLKRDFINLFKKHQVTHIIAVKSLLRNPECQYDLSQFKVILEDDQYIAYKVDAANLNELHLKD